MLRSSKAAPLEALAADATRAAPADLDDRVRAALGGDASALRDFLGAIAPTVRRVCRGVMGHETPDLEDTIQDCLLEVARSLPQFRFEGTVSHYVTKISMRRAIASRERARARAKQHAALDPSSMSNFDAAQEERAELVRHLLDGLNEAQAKALLLRIMLGHSIDEIASMTGVSANTVKTRLRLGKMQLRRWLQRSGEVRRERG